METSNVLVAVFAVTSRWRPLLQQLRRFLLSRKLGVTTDDTVLTNTPSCRGYTSRAGVYVVERDAAHMISRGSHWKVLTLEPARQYITARVREGEAGFVLKHWTLDLVAL